VVYIYIYIYTYIYITYFGQTQVKDFTNCRKRLVKGETCRLTQIYYSIDNIQPYAYNI